MKYALVMWVCSALTGDCLEATPIDIYYGSHAECVIDGAKKVHTVLSQMDLKDMNQHKLYMAYSCTQRSSI
jgi:hypothetical protein